MEAEVSASAIVVMVIAHAKGKSFLVGIYVLNQTNQVPWIDYIKTSIVHPFRLPLQ